MHPPYQPVAGVGRGVNSAVCWLLLQHRTYLSDERGRHGYRVMGSLEST